MIVRAATLTDLAQITEIHNHYVEHTHVSFDVRPFQPEQRIDWFHDHCDGNRHRMLVAQQPDGSLLGYASTGAFRSKEAYQTTVEVTVACRPQAIGQGVGSQLYQMLFSQLADADVHRVVAGIAQPNAASNAFHQRFGFKAVGIFSQVGRKFGQYWDVLWMEKAIESP